MTEKIEDSEILGALTGELEKKVTEDEDISRIKDKYGSDPDKLAKALKSIQSEHNKKINEFQAPKEYRISTEHASIFTKRQVDELTELAKEGEYSQKQFDALASKVAKQTAYDRQKRDEKKPEKETKKVTQEFDIDRLRAHYKGKYPDRVLEDILQNGSQESLRQLEDQRKKEIGDTKSPGASYGTSSSKEVDVETLYDELKKIKKERFGRTDAETVARLDRKSNEIAKKIARLVAKDRYLNEEQERKDYLGD